jgi:hypothetical protein
MGFFPNGASLPIDIGSPYIIPAYQGAKNYITSSSALPYYFQSLPIHTIPDEYDDILSDPCTGKSELKQQDKLLY